MDDPDYYAKIAYEARFCTYPGKHTRRWEYLDESVKDVWRTVADTVIDTWEGILR